MGGVDISGAMEWSPRSAAGYWCGGSGRFFVQLFAKPMIPATTYLGFVRDLKCVEETKMAKLLLLYSHYVFFKVMISFLAGRNFVELQARSCPCIMRGIFFSVFITDSCVGPTNHYLTSSIFLHSLSQPPGHMQIISKLNKVINIKSSIKFKF